MPVMTWVYQLRLVAGSEMMNVLAAICDLLPEEMSGRANCCRRGRWLVGLASIFCAVIYAVAVQAETPFSFNNVIDKARAEAGHPFTLNGHNVPDFLLKLSYDKWRDIRFLPEKSLWRGEKLPFEVQFFHPGLYYNRLVRINEVSAAGVKPIAFSPSLFNYGANDFVKDIPSDFGFAGFRLHYTLTNNKHLDEVAVFLGASYFRAVGKNQKFGLSARGLAINTGLDSGEEFPYFKEFWLEKPLAGSQEVVIYGLLDSESLTGAYRFSIHPGKQTVMVVKATIFRRKDVEKLGVAPLTSMFFYDQSINLRPVDDFRPEVHDSDGLLIADASGQMTWRPLVNRQQIFINAFQSTNPKGFGLLQRDVDFDHYLDTEARYDQRPSAWVMPDGAWGSGHVELVQIPTEKEANDNIVAYWVPAQLPGKTEPIEFAYQLQWYLPDQDPQAVGQVIATRTAAGSEANTRKIIIDFKGGKLDSLPKKLPTEAPLEAVVTVSDQGEIIEKQLFRVEATGWWRLVFQVKRKETGGLAEVLPEQLVKQPPLEIRAYLASDKSVLTETWSYAVWP